MPSKLEESLWLLLKSDDSLAGAVREYRFHPERRWRFDFAYPEAMVAVEAEGSVHRIKGRFARDLEKYNTAQLMGWRVFRFNQAMVDAGAPVVETLCEALGMKPSPRASMAAQEVTDGQP